MEPRRLIPVEIIPDVSLTRFYLETGDNIKNPGGGAEIHIAHHANGDLNDHAQWYNFYVNPDEHILAVMRTQLNINEDDWKIVEHMLGSFHWVLYKHSTPSEIRLDEKAMKEQEWKTTYF